MPLAASPAAAPEPSAPVPDPWAGLAAARAAFASVRDIEWWRIPEPELVAVARELESVVRSGAGVQVRLAAELAERGTAGTLGFRSPAALLHEILNVTMSAGRARLALARATLPHETPCGDTVEPELPELLDALDAGITSEGHAALVASTMAKVPAKVDGATRKMCRDLLVAQAAEVDVAKLAEIAEHIRLTVDEDGALDGRPPTDRAELIIGRRRSDGLTAIRGLLDPLTTEALRQALEPLSEPRPIDEHHPDPRSAPLRRAQALGEMCARYLSIGKAPKDGGVRPQVVVTVELERLITGLGPALAEFSGPIPAATARMLACSADLIPQVLGSTSEVLDQGRKVRLFPPEIRRAITTRDRGCAFPSCDSPAGWCEVHHIAWWKRDLGPTSVRNGVLLCRRHHVVIHQGEWEIRMPETEGSPQFIPPPHIDPARVPRRNRQWDLPKVVLAGPMTPRATDPARTAVMRT